MNVEFIASVSAITPDPKASRALYVDALGLPLEPPTADDEYIFSDRIPGSKHFGVWPLSQAAQACFGTPDWPADRPVPQVSIEFDLGTAEGVAAGAAELEAAGFTLLHRTREEPWGQTIARLQSPEGCLIGLSYAPWQH